MIVYGEPLRPYLEAALSENVPEGAQFLGYTVDGEPTAVIGFHSYTAENVEMAVTASRMTPDFVCAAFNYIFKQLNCDRVTVRIRDDNEKSIRMAQRLGFKLEGRVRKARAGRDMLIFGLLKEEEANGWWRKRWRQRSDADRPDEDNSGRGAGESNQQDYAVRLAGVRA